VLGYGVVADLGRTTPGDTRDQKRMVIKLAVDRVNVEVVVAPAVVSRVIDEPMVVAVRSGIDDVNFIVMEGHHNLADPGLIERSDRRRAGRGWLVLEQPLDQGRMVGSVRATKFPYAVEGHVVDSALGLGPAKRG